MANKGDKTYYNSLDEFIQDAAKQVQLNNILSQILNAVPSKNEYTAQIKDKAGQLINDSQQAGDTVYSHFTNAVDDTARVNNPSEHASAVKSTIGVTQADRQLKDYMLKAVSQVSKPEQNVIKSQMENKFENDDKINHDITIKEKAKSTTDENTKLPEKDTSSILIDGVSDIGTAKKGIAVSDSDIQRSKNALQDILNLVDIFQR